VRGERKGDRKKSARESLNNVGPCFVRRISPRASLSSRVLWRDKERDVGKRRRLRENNLAVLLLISCRASRRISEWLAGDPQARGEYYKNAREAKKNPSSVESNSLLQKGRSSSTVYLKKWGVSGPLSPTSSNKETRGRRMEGTKVPG